MTIIHHTTLHETILCQSDYYSPRMQRLLKDIDGYIAKPLKVLKDDPTSTVVVVEVDGHKLVIKRANTKDWMHVLRRFFSASRARKNWHYAHQLLKIGVKSFKPVAIKELRFGPLKGRSYLITTYIEGINARQFFEKTALKDASAQRVANNIVKMIDNLAYHWLSHRDLNLSNIILVNEEPWLIDLDSMRHHLCKPMARRGAKRERARFLENWCEAPLICPETVALFQAIFSKSQPT